MLLTKQIRCNRVCVVYNLLYKTEGEYKNTHTHTFANRNTGIIDQKLMTIVTYGVGGRGCKELRGRLLCSTSFYIVSIFETYKCFTYFKNIIKSKRILKQPLKRIEKTNKSNCISH